MTVLVSRRRLLAGSAAALALAACSDGGPAEADVDLDFAGTAAGVEKLALDHYTATGLLMTGGKLGALVPPALGALFATATGHHRQAHDAWNKVRTDAGRAAVTAPPAKLQEALNAASLRQFDVPAAVNLAIRVEDYACQTYQQAIPDPQGPRRPPAGRPGRRRRLPAPGRPPLPARPDPVQQAGADPRLGADHRLNAPMPASEEAGIGRGSGRARTSRRTS